MPNPPLSHLSFKVVPVLIGLLYGSVFGGWWGYGACAGTWIVFTLLALVSYPVAPESGAERYARLSVQRDLAWLTFVAAVFACALSEF